MKRAVFRTALAVITLVAIGASLIATGTADTGTMVARAVTPLAADAALTTPLGSLMPGASVAVPATGAPAQVTVTAWYAGTAAAVLMTQPGQRLVVARLNPAGVTAETPLTTQPDSYGTIWHQVQIKGFVDQKQLASDATTVFAEASVLYGARCSSCHALHQPSEYTANQWPAIVASMQRNAGISDDQAALILAYIQRLAKHT